MIKISSIGPNNKHIEKLLLLGKKLQQMIPSTVSLKLWFDNYLFFKLLRESREFCKFPQIVIKVTDLSLGSENYTFLN